MASRYVREAKMSLFYKGSAIDQLLSDPVTLAMMEADHVDPVAFKQMLDRTGRRLRGDRTS